MQYWGFLIAGVMLLFVLVAFVLRPRSSASGREALDFHLGKFGFKRVGNGAPLIHAFVSPFEEILRSEARIEWAYVSERELITEYLFMISSAGSTATDLSRAIYAVQLPLILDHIEFGPARLGVTDVGTRGANAVRFESDPFNQNFAVSGSDREIVFAIVHERMMEFFESALTHQWAFSGPFGRCEIRDYTEVANCREFVEQFLELIPEYVKQERQIPRPTLLVEVEPDLIRYKR